MPSTVAYVRLGNLLHVNGGLNPPLSKASKQSASGELYGGQHSHMVSPVRSILPARRKVAAHYNCDRAPIDTSFTPDNIANRFVVQSKALVSCQGFSAEF